MKNFIEVEVYGDKGIWSMQIAKFSSVESLKKTWQLLGEQNVNFGQIRDDNGSVFQGISYYAGYKIRTRPPYEKI